MGINNNRQQRLDALRLLEARRALSNEERTELAQLLREADAEEAAALRPAMRRKERQRLQIQTEKDALDAQAAALERICAEQDRLLADTRTYLTQLRAKRSALADDYRRVTGRELAARR